jgi:hypothetical protein
MQKMKHLFLLAQQMKPGVLEHKEDKELIKSLQVLTYAIAG